MSGYSAAGKIPITATSFPGFALMIESINMAYMMELPMVIVLVQRLGPATGSATCGAQGDIDVVNGVISGGMSLPMISLTNSNDCWELSAKAIEMAVEMRTPVVLLTSKEEVMTMYSYDFSSLKEINKIKRNYYSDSKPYLPYLPLDNLVPEFLPVTNNKHQVRFTASTHDRRGIIQNTSDEALQNSRRLNEKILLNMEQYQMFELDEQEGAEILLFSYGISSAATKEAVIELRKANKKVSMCLAKTLLPVPDIYYDIVQRYKITVFVEENLTGQYKALMFGKKSPKNIVGINKIGKMIEPNEIIELVLTF
jgi:2-oxoglutarate ferredoxin oxidoreductase subunit alpha